MQLDQNFWNSRYAANETGWDLGGPSTPLKRFIDSLTDKQINILIPGCGNAYEAQYLHELGFTSVHVIDIAPLALEGFASRVPDFPERHLICGDFFSHQGQYDLILEQTFFCAIDPSLRSTYAKQMHQLLKPSGVLAGVVFGVPMNTDRPPFGGSREEYLLYFDSLFHVQALEMCHDSIAPRLGSELWMELRKLG